jgi:hypothetical protein
VSEDDASDAPSPTSEPAAAAPPAADAGVQGAYYRGVIARVFYGSESGTLTSEATGRTYHFRTPSVRIIGPIPRVDGLREGMRVGFDVGWTSRGLRVSVIRVFD